MRYTCQTSPRFIKKSFFNIHPITQSVLVIMGMSMTVVSAHAATNEAANGEAESTLPSLTFTTTATKTPTLVKNTIAYILLKMVGMVRAVVSDCVVTPIAKS